MTTISTSHSITVASLAAKATEIETLLPTIRSTKHHADCTALVAAYDRLGWAMEFGDREDRVLCARAARKAQRRAYDSATN
jgi:hypothetical protein